MKHAVNTQISKDISTQVNKYSKKWGHVQKGMSV